MLSSPGDINVKKLAFTPYCGVGGGGGGGGEGEFIQTSTMTPLSATVSPKCVGVGRKGEAVVTNAFHSYNVCWYMRALNNNGNEHRR